MLSTQPYPLPPPLHTVWTHTLVLIHTGGGGGGEPVRKLEGRLFTRVVENTNMTDCISHRLNMEVDLQSLFGLHVTWCAQLYSLAETPQPPPYPPASRLVKEGAIGQQK